MLDSPHAEGLTAPDPQESTPKKEASDFFFAQAMRESALDGSPALQLSPTLPTPAAEWGWRRRVRQLSLGVVRPKAGVEEQEHLEAIRTIRQSVWTRAVNVIVANEKGSTGKTPTTLILAGYLALVRGGYVAAFEATENQGYLTKRGEGEPTLGLAELLKAEGISSAGAVGGFTAPQTSHADVIGTTHAREELTGEDVLALRRILDSYYRITVADTANNTHHSVFQAAVSTADAMVIPVTPTPSAVIGAQRTLDAVARIRPRNPLHPRTLVLITHDGGHEPLVVSEVRAEFEMRGLTVMEVPFDPEIRRDSEITLARMTESSRRAWILVAAQVATMLRTIDSTSLVPPTSTHH